MPGGRVHSTGGGGAKAALAARRCHRISIAMPAALNLGMQLYATHNKYYVKKLFLCYQRLSRLTLDYCTFRLCFGPL